MACSKEAIPFPNSEEDWCYDISELQTKQYEELIHLKTNTRIAYTKKINSILLRLGIKNLKPLNMQTGLLMGSLATSMLNQIISGEVSSP